MNGLLKISTANINGKTVADNIYFTPPFKVYSPFYRGNTAEFISMSASAGILAGDNHEINLNIGKNCNVRFTDQGYQKLFNTGNSSSSQKTIIKVGEMAFLRYRPHPIMTFCGCVHKADSVVDICKNSQIVYSEIYCCGRTASGEEFSLSEFRSRTEIRINGMSDFIDNTLIRPESLPIKHLGFFEKYTHSGFMYIYSDRISKSIFDTLDDQRCEIGISETEKGFVIRVLADSAEKIALIFDKIEESVRQKQF